MAIVGDAAAPMALLRPIMDRYRFCEACGLAWPADYKRFRPTRYRRAAGGGIRVTKSECVRPDVCLCGRDWLSLPIGQIVKVIPKEAS